jgi:hypothetical protein
VTIPELIQQIEETERLILPERVPTRSTAREGLHEQHGEEPMVCRLSPLEGNGFEPSVPGR